MPDSRQLVVVRWVDVSTWTEAAQVSDKAAAQEIVALAADLRQELLVHHGPWVAQECEAKSYEMWGENRATLMAMYLRDTGDWEKFGGRCAKGQKRRASLGS